MSENAKTIVFVLVGLLAISIGIYSRPTSAEIDDSSLIGADLTKNFDSPDKAKHLRIVRFNEDTATLQEFEVAEQDGLWSIPSKNGYPADAARQMAEAATSLMDRKILQIVSSNAGDHEEFGVVDPRSPKLEVGQKGVGTRVTMSDVNDSMLVDLIVGKPVKDAEGQRYVREAGRDKIYIIEIDPTKLSTNFEDWIEKDLLKLNAWDLRQVQIKDYSAELTPVMTQDGRMRFQLAGDMRSEMTLDYNDTDSKWTAEKLRQFDMASKQYTDFTLAEDEELNNESLNALKTALDDLQIVDVVKKPQGLSNDLKAGADFLNNAEALQDLVSKGFTPASSPGGGGPEEIISSDGEVIASLKNGAEYVLRFGNLTNVGTDGQPTGEEAAVAGQSNASKEGGVHRYLFVMARLNEDGVKRPELQVLPELPAEEPATEAKPEGDAAAAADAAPTDKPADGEVDSPTDEAAAKPETTETAATETEKPADAAATDAAKTDDAAKADDAAATAESEKTKKLEELVAERKRIEQENQRKEDEYKQSLEKGREAVKDLNLRFGDWYFVVADDVFKKIRLGRENVVKKKEAKPAGEAGAAPGTTPPISIPGIPPIPGISQ